MSSPYQPDQKLLLFSGIPSDYRKGTDGCDLLVLPIDEGTIALLQHSHAAIAVANAAIGTLSLSDDESTILSVTLRCHTVRCYRGSDVYIDDVDDAGEVTALEYAARACWAVVPAKDLKFRQGSGVVCQAALQLYDDGRISLKAVTASLDATGAFVETDTLPLQTIEKELKSYV